MSCFTKIAMGVLVFAVPAMATCAEKDTTYYIMGYGSLMKESSRVKTSCGIKSMTASTLQSLTSVLEASSFDHDTAECIALTKKQKMIPVRVEGVRRGWYSRGGLVLTGEPGWEAQALDVAPTYLGAFADESAELVAVVYPVTEHQLALTDERERSGTYTPGWLSVSDVKPLNLNDTINECAKIRWYPQTLDQVQPPSEQFPICQSYVDLFLSGVKLLGEQNDLPDLLQEVVKTTWGWSSFWVNDRPIPYRPFAMEADAFSVTKVLVQAARSPWQESGGQDIPLMNEAFKPLSLDILKGIYFPGSRPPALRSAQQILLP